MRLFSYCVRIDDGAAPNPYWNTCTLAICKPRIRAVAQTGDWVAGVGSKNVNGTSYQGRLVYAMRISRVMSLEEYDEYCRKTLPRKIPDLRNTMYARKVGDCIYDFRKDLLGWIRPGVHNEKNRDADLSGKNVLLSDHFYYFGNRAIDIPAQLAPIVRQEQGHRSTCNEPYKNDFVRWIENAGYAPNFLHGEPQIILQFSRDKQGCVSVDKHCNSVCEEMDNEGPAC